MSMPVHVAEEPADNEKGSNGEYNSGSRNNDPAEEVRSSGELAERRIVSGGHPAPVHNVGACKAYEVCRAARGTLDGLDVLAVLEVAVTRVGGIEELGNIALERRTCEFLVDGAALLVVDCNAVLVNDHEACAAQVNELTGKRLHNSAVRTSGNDGNNVPCLAGSIVGRDRVSNEDGVAVAGPVEHFRNGRHIDNALIVHREVLKYSALASVDSFDDGTAVVEDHHIEDIRIRSYCGFKLGVSAAHSVCDVNSRLAFCDSPHDGGIAFERLLYSGRFGLTHLLEGVILGRPFVSHNGKCAYCSDDHRRNYREYQHDSGKHDLQLQIAHYLIPLKIFYLSPDAVSPRCVKMR